MDGEHGLQYSDFKVLLEVLAESKEELPEPPAKLPDKFDESHEWFYVIQTDKEEKPNRFKLGVCMEDSTGHRKNSVVKAEAVIQAHHSNAVDYDLDIISFIKKNSSDEQDDLGIKLTYLVTEALYMHDHLDKNWRLRHQSFAEEFLCDKKGVNHKFVENAVRIVSAACAEAGNFDDNLVYRLSDWLDGVCVPEFGDKEYIYRYEEQEQED